MKHRKQFKHENICGQRVLITVSKRLAELNKILVALIA